MEKEQLHKELMKAADGLLIKSEIEAPFEFVYLDLPEGKKQLTPEDVAKWAGKPAGMAVQTRGLEEFLQQMQGLVSDARKRTPEGKNAFEQLTKTLNNNLKEVKVYCITEIGTEAYILGQAEDGNYAGLRTMIIQGEATVEEE